MKIIINKRLQILILGIGILIFNGCSYIGIGHSETFCQENGCDYSDAGVCGDTYYIYKNYSKIKKVAYKDFNNSSYGEKRWR